MRRQQSNHGFTLIEISIVLVIIGLIVGGVLAGQDLIKAAQIRKIYSEYQAFDTAANTYKLKYNALAGDHANAHQFFGDACGNNTTDPDTGCNGDGDGKIGSTTAPADPFGEEAKFFEHISRAGLIAGSYDGSCVQGDGCEYNAGINVPKSTFKGAIWGLKCNSCEECDLSTILGTNNVFIFTAARRTDGDPNSAFGANYNGALTVQDMWSLDSKYDDGMPNTGRILTFGFTSTECVSGQDAIATYNLTTATEKCTAYFRMSGF